jgi:hypothetical protein
MPSPARVDNGRVARVIGVGARGAAAILALLAALLAGLGWLYVLRGLGWLAIGPNVRDSLPLLQLAGFDIQPLGRVVAAWLAAGVVAGVVLTRVPRLWRAMLAGLLGIVLLLFASQASFALTRNLRLSGVIWSRRPGIGPLLEALLFAAGCALPGRVRRGLLAHGGQRSTSSVTVAWRERVCDLGLRHGQHGNAREHQRDREEVGDVGGGAASE